MLNKNGTETERNHEVHTDNSDVGFPNYVNFITVRIIGTIGAT